MRDQTSGGGRHARGGGAHRAPRDAGFSLVEYSVSMGIFAVVIGITVSGVTFMARDTVKTTNLSTATDQTRQAFTKLDRQVRYARAINRPGKNTAGNRWYVEFLGPDGNGVEACTQWRLDTTTKQLAYRQWAPTATTLPTTFLTVASNIANDTTAAQAPFTFVMANTDIPQQSLRIKILGRRASNSTSTVTLETTIAARNSSVSSQSNEDTNPADGNSDNPVCKFGTGVNRP
jgi:type II secretory pathway pseudopilin PulG